MWMPRRFFLAWAGLRFIGRKSVRCLFTNGEVRPKSEGKILFQRNFCYYAALGEDSACKSETLGYVARGKRSQEPFFDFAGQGSGIISINLTEMN
jgi:hypothetical protein